ncbi:hypothetical protein G9A89_015285 [Geosiphon pyriformis]|nr:hypothetical protein G9A89_015285 [Geosiphon pyriformis]
MEIETKSGIEMEGFRTLEISVQVQGQKIRRKMVDEHNDAERSPKKRLSEEPSRAEEDKPNYLKVITGVKDIRENEQATWTNHFGWVF